MRRHTTHHDDCGCLTARYKIAINALEALKKHQEIAGRAKICPILYRTFESLKKLDEEINAL